jgi:hypothetical protein
MPTSAQYTFEPGTAKLDPIYPNSGARTMNVKLSAGTYTRGVTLGELTASPGTYAAYASGNTDGTQNPKGLLQYSCVVDGSGNVTLAGEFGQTQLGVPMYVGGGAIFDTTQLSVSGGGAITTAVITALGGSLVEGTAAAGQLRF